MNDCDDNDDDDGDEDEDEKRTGMKINSFKLGEETTAARLGVAQEDA